MFDVSRILAIPDESVDYLQCGIAGKERAALAARGFVRKDGTKAKDSMIRTIQKAAKNKAKAEKAVIKGDKKLPVKPSKGVVPDSIPSNVVFAIQEVERQKIQDKFLSTINPSTQKFNETYQIVPTSKASENSRNTYQKAQSIAKENGWDWDGIVKKVAKEDKFFNKNDMRRMKELRTRSNLFAKNEKKQSQFMAEKDRDVAQRTTNDKPVTKTESAQKTRTPIGGKSFNVKRSSSPVSSIKARSRKIDKASVKDNLAIGDKVVLASANKSIPASVETVKKINKKTIVVDRVNSITGKAESKSIPTENIAVIQKKNGKNVSVKGNPITGNLSVEQKQFRSKTGKTKPQNTAIAPQLPVTAI